MTKKEPLIQIIYETYERWKWGNETDKGFYDMYIGLIVEEEPVEFRNNYYTYWESLKENE